MLPSRYQPIGNPQNGGFGSVVRVRDTYLDRDVMFKVMHDPNANDQLTNEVMALSQARSKHVVEIYDAVRNSAGKLTGIIIEALDGRTYESFHMEAARFPLEFVKILYQISCGLADLHSAGIIHRDLKLENFRDSSEGVLKLFDFGISSTRPDYITQTNRGTLVYAAPELYLPNARITTALDIYAFGICAWALASMQLPHELLERPPQQARRVASISSVMGGALDHRVASIIDACLDPNPSGRPTAAMIQNTLKEALISGKHRGRFVQGSKQVYEMSSNAPFVRISVPGKGILEVRYNGYEFNAVGVQGDVMINRLQAQVGLRLPEACVLAFGSDQTGRTFVTFSSSHPEIVI